MSLERTIRQMMSEAVDPTDTGGAEEASMAMRQIKAIRHFADGIEMRVAQQGDMEEWYQNKLTKAHDYLKTLYAYGKGDKMMEEAKVKCPRCGTMNDPSNDKCTNCGLPMSQFDSFQKEEVDMDKLHDAIKKKLSDEGGAAGFAPLKDVAKKMGVDLTPEMLKGMDDIEQHRDGDYILDVDDDDEEEMEEMKVRGKEVYDKTFANRTQADNYAKKHGGRVQQVGRVFFVFKEEVEIEENVGAPRTAAHRRAQMTRNPSKSGGTGYDLYHKDFSSAMKHAYDYAKNKLGVEIDPKEIDDKVASGPRKPSKGKTNTYRLMGKDGKKAVQIQVHGMDSGKYELNMYKESVELDEAKSKEQQIADLEKMLNSISGNTASVRMKKFALQRKIDKLKNEELEEAYKTPAEAGAYEAGKKAARAGKKYDDNPNKKGSKEYTAWSKGHNEARAKGMREEVELDENKNLIKDYQDMKAQGKKDSNILDALMSMPKYKRMSKDQMAKIIGDAKRKGIFKEDVELDEAFTTAIKFPNYFKMDEKERNKIIDIYKKYRGKISSQVGKDGSVTVDGDPTSMRKAEAELKKAGVKFMATESVELEEKKGEPPFDVSKADYAGAAKELTQYAKTKGGMDKDDFLSFANRMASIARKKSPSVMSKFVRDLQGLDTDVREKIVSVMRNNGIKVTMSGRGFQVEDYTDHSVGMSIMERAIASIRERELTDTELKRREEIAKDLPDQEFKDRYGDKWMQVKMATATKMAKGEK